MSVLLVRDFVTTKTATQQLRPYMSPNNKARCAHTTPMNTRPNNNDSNPTNKMIQGNKDEADSMLSLWGMKGRKHLKTNRIRKRR